LALAVLASCAPAIAQTDVTSVKATFLYRFSSLIAWPGARDDAPTTLCVAGPRQYERAIERVISAAGTQRRFDVRRLDDASDVEACRVLYIVEDETRAREMLRAAAGKPVLTVTDANVTPDVRGIIHFAIVENRVRFHIDDDLAERGGLAIDSRLLALALSVRRRD
jgi:hypothetical protein